MGPYSIGHWHGAEAGWGVVNRNGKSIHEGLSKHVDLIDFYDYPGPDRRELDTRAEEKAQDLCDWLNDGGSLDGVEWRGPEGYQERQAELRAKYPREPDPPGVVSFICEPYFGSEPASGS